MRRYVEDDLALCEELLAEIRNRILRHWELIHHLDNPTKVELAYSLLDTLMETAPLYEEERVRMVEALGRKGASAGGVFASG
jgi:hypothetical protein